jgi:dipeptidase E
LLDNVITDEGIQQKIKQADIIYVGGGNTKMMMQLWKERGVDSLLTKARNSGKVLCGLSAGSICWYESGHSDSASFDAADNWDYIRVTGLNFIPAIHCPHYDSATDGKPRRESFYEFIKLHKGVGIGVDECAAIVWQDDIYNVTEQNGIITESIIPETGKTAELLD